MTISEVLDEHKVSEDQLKLAAEAVKKDEPTGSSPTEIFLFCSGVSRLEKYKAQAEMAIILREILTPEQMGSAADMRFFIDFLTAKRLLLDLIKGS